MKPIPGRNAQRTAVVILFFCFGLGFSTWAAGIPAIQEKLRLSDAVLGYLLFAIPLGDLLAIPVSAWLAAKIGTGKISLIAVVSYAVVLFSLAIVRNSFGFGILLFLFGVASNFTSLCVNTQSVLVQKHFEKSVMGFFHGTWSFAGFAGAAIGILVSWLHLPTSMHFAFVSVILIVSAIISSKWLISDHDSSVSKKAFAWPDSKILVLGIMGLTCFMVEGTMFDWSGIYFKKVVNPPVEFQGFGYASFMACMATGRFLSDKVIDKLGALRTMVISSLLITSGLFMAVGLPYFFTVIAGFALVGFGVASVVPIVFNEAGKSEKFLPSTAITLVGSIGFIGFLFGPPMIGSMSAALGLRVSLLLISGFGIMLGLLSVMLRKIIWK